MTAPQPHTAGQPSTQRHIMLDRFLARLIDGAILLIPALILSAISTALFAPSLFDPSGSFFVTYFVSGLLITALYVGYEAFFLGTQHGQTIGKKVMKLKVAGENGEQAPDLQVALQRAAVLFGGYLLYALGGLAIVFTMLGGLVVLAVALSPFLDNGGSYRGLHDKLAKTVVVRST